MNKLLLINLLIVFVLSCGCSGSKQINQTEREQNPAIKEIIVSKDFNPHHQSRNFRITTAQIIENVLEVNVEYSGGCKQHELTMYTNLAYQKSLPPILPLFLVHDDNGDACRELIQEKLLFKVNTLQYKGVKTVKLQINQEYLVEYNYE